MKAVVLSRTGGAENLEMQERERPTPGPRQVLVRVRACGVGYRDLIERAGGHPGIRVPIVQGHEFSGEVVAVGPETRMWAPGDRVINLYGDSCGCCADCLGGDERACAAQTQRFGLTADGGYAEYVCASERALERLHPGIDFVAAATLMSALGVGYHNVVHRAAVGPGEQVLISGASGGVGIGALQAARLVGAHVWAVTSSAHKVERLRALGADEMLIDDGRTFHKQLRQRLPRGVDAAIDCVGEATIHGSLRALRTGGRLVAIGNIGTRPYALNLGHLMLNRLSILGSDNITRRSLRELMALVAEGKLRPVIDRVLPLEQAAEAHRLLERREVFGRVVLLP